MGVVQLGMKPRQRRRTGESIARLGKAVESTADRLRSLREVAGHSRKAAAESTGIPERTLVRYEDGTRPPSAAAVVAIARAYRVTTDWILTGSRKAVSWSGCSR